MALYLQTLQCVFAKNNKDVLLHNHKELLISKNLT